MAIFLGASLQIAFSILGLLVARAAITTARTPQGATAWVVFLVSFPLLAIPTFAIFGSVSRLRTGSDLEHAAVALVKGTGRLGQITGIAGIPITENNTVELLIDGEETFKAMFEAIDGASREVLVQFYIIRADQVGNALRDRLIAAARRGVEVRVLCDALGSLFLGMSYVRALQAEGIKFQGTTGPHRALGRIAFNFRNHRKAVIVDGTIGFTGGINVGQEYIDGGKKFDSWRDTHLQFSGPMVTQLRDLFASDWQDITGEEFPDLDVGYPSGVTRGLVTGFGATDELERGSLLLCGLIGLASRRLWIATPYLVPHTDLLTALQLAALRGVDVRILIPKSSDNILAWYASRSTTRDLSKAGISVYEYLPGFMHSKVMLIDDDLASVGTINLDIRSALLNFEETALIEDEVFAEQVETMLEADFARSKPVSVPGPFHVRALAPIARLFGPLL